jgi:hypothetical protein
MGKLSVSVLVGVVASSVMARAASGASEPLLVVVETPPGLGVDASDVRRTIAAELGTGVSAPRDDAARNASDVLIVALERGEIRMSLRTGAAGVVSRTIPAPPERPARLRAIGWLAGNLARDQASAVMTALPSEPATMLPAAPAAPAAAEPAPRPATEPPPAFASLPATGMSPPSEAISAKRDPPNRSTGAQWAITALAGPTALVVVDQTGTVDRYSAGYEVTVQRQATPDSLIFGAAIHAGPHDWEDHVLGLAVFAGSAWRHGRWFLEATGGLGLEADRLPTSSRTVTENSSGPTGITETLSVTDTLQPVIFFRAAADAGVSVSRLVDLVAQLGAHLGSGGQRSDYLSAGAGLRFKIP